MAAILSLRDYGSDGSSSGEELPSTEDVTAHLKPIINHSQLQTVNAAPLVISNEGLDNRRIIDPDSKELTFNPKYEDLYAPVVGPINPFKTTQEEAVRNMLSGHTEPSHLSNFQFEAQRRTFHSYGHAIDPSIENSGGSGDVYVGNTCADECGKTVFESTKSRMLDKRKRDKNDKPEDIEGFLGPWGGYTDEQRVMKPNEQQMVELQEILSKRKKRGKHTEEKDHDEKSTLHIKDSHDYQGRSYLHVPQDVGINLKADHVPDKCFIPKKLVHTWQGHSKGIHAVRWLPVSAHLMLSCSMDCKVKLWEVFDKRRCIRSYIGHRQAVRDICFNRDGTKFLSAGYDRMIKLWDTETGQCTARFSSRKIPYCVVFNPNEDLQHLFIAGTSDRKIICWDVRTEEVVQEYDRHLGAVNSITFVDENRRFVSTSDDKSLRVWEWDIPVDMKYIAETGMHSLPAVTPSPNGKWLACQSMDNRIRIFSTQRLKIHRKKTFDGHMVAGYACKVDFAPDMSYLVSGDADGKAYVWDWKSTKLYSKWKAHDDVCIAALWHPHETSKVLTAGWDGLIKYWD